MRLFFSLFWTICCIGLGIAAGTINVGGQTCWQHAQRLWKTEKAPLVDEVKNKVVTVVKDAHDRPLDRHSAEERSELEKLIANRQHEGK